MIAHEAAPPPDEAAPVVGDYQLMRRLGSGAMGEVWLGRHTTTGTLAALKLLRQSLKSRDRVAKTFDRERRAIGRLGHPHIVALFDVGKDWLATAYVDGTDLARRLKTPIDPAAAVHLTLQIASAFGTSDTALPGGSPGTAPPGAGEGGGLSDSSVLMRRSKGYLSGDGTPSGATARTGGVLWSRTAGVFAGEPFGRCCAGMAPAAAISSNIAIVCFISGLV